MEMGDNEVDSTTPSKAFNDSVNASEEWIPMRDEELKPVIGMVFDTLEEGEDFYKRYAHATGFSICKSSETKDKNGMKWKYFLCSKQGFKVERNKAIAELLVDEKKMPKTRRRKLTREGCDAKIVFKRTMEEKYEVVRFHEVHTHVLATPRKKQFLRSSREVSNVHKNL
ncbi:FAR1 DNA-binding domain [Sesbania bispinosa]|nr:FAR1 DNA-binding domain [Sesbania bispinosa]